MTSFRPHLFGTPVLVISSACAENVTTKYTFFNLIFRISFTIEIFGLSLLLYSELVVAIVVVVVTYWSSTNLFGR